MTPLEPNEYDTGELLDILGVDCEWAAETVRDRIATFYRDAVTERLQRLYTIAEAKEWLDAPHQQLAGLSALEVINRGDGIKVLAIVEGLTTGAFA